MKLDLPYDCEWQFLDDLIRRSQTFAITTHVNPDGDALGSELALYQLLRQRNKTVRIINNNLFPEVYSFLPGASEHLETYCPEDNRWIAECDVIFVLDISTLDRVGSMKESVRTSSAAKVCIDHHPEAESFADFEIRQVSASATAEIIYDLFIRLKGIMTRSIAENLYVSILTDTNAFSNKNTRPRTHLVIAELLKTGIDPVEIYSRLYQNYSWPRFLLQQKAIANLSSDYGGKLVWQEITNEMITEYGAKREELDGFVDLPMTIKGVELSLLFLEVPGKGTKISLRSGDNIDSHQFAGKFGGGGHRHAAGIRCFNVEMKNAVEMVLQKARELFPDNPSD